MVDCSWYSLEVCYLVEWLVASRVCYDGVPKFVDGRRFGVFWMEPEVEEEFVVRVHCMARG